MTQPQTVIHPIPSSDHNALWQPPSTRLGVQLSCALLVIVSHLLALLWMSRAPEPVTEAKPEVVAIRWMVAPEAQTIAAPRNAIAVAKPDTRELKAKAKRQPTQVSPMQRQTSKLPAKEPLKFKAREPSQAPIKPRLSEQPAKPIVDPAPDQPSQSDQIAAATLSPAQRTQTTAITSPSVKAAYLRNPAPTYPPLSRRFREEGRVVLSVQVSPQGEAMAVELHTSSGHPRLDSAAKKTVTRWRFIPARRGDTAVTAWVEIPIIFQLRS